MPATIIPTSTCASGSADDLAITGSGSISQLAASTPALSASSDIPVSSNAAALSMANFYEFTTIPTQRTTNDVMNSGDLVANGAGFDDQLQHSWMQALMAQSGSLYQPANSYALAHPTTDGSPRVGNMPTSGEFQTQSSDSDSDDISKSLSYLLNQHINQPGGSSAVSSQYHSRQQSGLILPQGTGNANYNSALNSMLEMGYDSGRRVISMPNPLDSLSLDLPIHPPPSLPPQSVVQPMLGLVPGHLMSGKNAAAMGYGSATPAGTSTSQYNFLGSNLPSAASLVSRGIVRPGGGECMSNFLDFGHSGMTFATTPSFSPHQPPIKSIVQPASSIALDTSKSALGITTGKRGMPTVSATTRGTKRSVSASVDVPKEASMRNRRGRPPAAKTLAVASGVTTRANVTGSKHPALLEPKLEAGFKPKGDVSRDSVFQSPHSAVHSSFATPMHSGLGTPSGMSTPTLASAVSTLIPHRVDRQLAEVSRPLFFVRPRTSDDQPRRRKRRCVSSGASLSHSTKSITEDNDLSTAASAQGSHGIKPGECEPEEPNLQWQRISEQRRRDAMRENFDLLKRMLPQGYMTSDDGRELARPVLLARFLRWVDDTLIEMESLKGEVAHLRLTAAAQNSAGAVAELWQHSNALQDQG
ncbi:hypothetical protein H4S04_005812 [Coemansia sp. S16]|nr:hypothetical protein GGI14_003706 [Coemansia sp. S680]KAJ2032108.1 hypothetical protein H4S03_006357 [Coemansia sp. S3946]KAJ2045154.1 hypothetical protein H4S04_005812 [Coemansia sp. S16]KAJ2068453.1 hypothetical protein GGI08_000867 [Coemansia sp. S2]KAJ2070922.1 hypothetical protein GGH13_003697 [Coemansia sp. S155-1]